MQQSTNSTSRVAVVRHGPRNEKKKKKKKKKERRTTTMTINQMHL
jgi:hypothetical protein